MRFLSVFLLATIATSSAIAKIPDEPLLCGTEQKQVCGPGRACQAVDGSKSFVRIDLSKNIYTRCDGKSPCDTYNVVRSGDYEKYVTIELTGRGAFAKIGPNMDFMEVVSLGGAAFVSHGTCFTEREVKE